MTTLPHTTTTRLSRPIGQGSISVAGPVHPHQAQPSGSGMTAGDVWRVIRANMWMLICGVILSGLIGYGAFYLLNRYCARYTARGSIQIVPTRAPNLLKSDGREEQVETGAMAIEQRTHATWLRSEWLYSRFLDKAQNSQAVKGTDWYKQFLKREIQADGNTREVFNYAGAKDDLASNLSVTPEPDTRAIWVGMTYRQPK